jgi:TetR/AcrR family transcriptional repressor of uid operon
LNIKDNMPVGTSAVRDSIIKTATELFGNSGFHQTPISELAAQARVSVGSIYRLFQDKNDLIVAIVRSDLERQLQPMQSIIPQVRSGDITVEDGLYQFIENARSHRNGTLSFDILAESYRNSSIAEEVYIFYSVFRDLARELAYVSNPDLHDQRLDDAQEVILRIAFQPGWSGLPVTHSQANTDTVQAIRIITRMLQTF